MERAGVLYLVPVPIGNAEDITQRAIRTLREVDVVAAEDTRDFGELARRHRLRTPSVSYHDHNERERAPELLDRLRAGTSVALVSDAGTPLLNDPGFRLVRAAIEAGVSVVALPGPSAVTTALAVSGLPAIPFRFCGFPPRTAAARRAWYRALAHDDATLVCFEAPHRLIGSLEDAAAALGDRQAALARNLTKPHERVQRGRLRALAALLRGEGEVRGEATVVIAGDPEGPAAAAAARAEEAAALLLEAGVGSRTVGDLLTRVHGLRRRETYDLIQRLQRSRHR
ncbi:MAG TPA: 16S rRNA (cytidine(1402)-2'-O)-methyltransferase [candidate division Zixibacteria bacterium]|nr:16S rRNA (cytidine(1402)-2'-O)-methyltransferase [candidate division Zixibacteria bacterium]